MVRKLFGGKNVPSLNKEKLVSSINNIWINKSCLLCGRSNWSVGDLLTLNEVAESGVKIGGNLFPVVPVVCNSCGNTIFINPVVNNCIDEDVLKKNISSN
jgi:hypothetical protein